jgi:hypothetical protein
MLPGPFPRQWKSNELGIGRLMAATRRQGGCFHCLNHATKQAPAADEDPEDAKLLIRSGKWKKRLKKWITPPT